MVRISFLGDEVIWLVVFDVRMGSSSIVACANAPVLALAGGLHGIHPHDTSRASFHTPHNKMYYQDTPGTFSTQ